MEATQIPQSITGIDQTTGAAGLNKMYMSQLTQNKTEADKTVSGLQTEGDAARAKLEPEIQAASAKLNKSVDDSTKLPAELPKDTSRHMNQEELMSAFTIFSTVAALGGLLTRTPMTAALNNMAAAIEGIKKGDEDQYKKSYEEFDHNFKKAMETNKAYLDEQDRVTKNAKLSLDEKMREWNMVAQKYGNPVEIATLRMNDAEKFLNHIGAAAKNAQAAEDKASALKMHHEEKLLQIESMKAAREQTAAIAGLRAGDVDAVKAQLDKVKAGVADRSISKEVGDKMEARLTSGGKGSQSAKLGEERAAALLPQLRLANKEIEELHAKGTKMPFLGDVHVDNKGFVTAATRYGINRDLNKDEQRLVVAAKLYGEAAGHLQSGARLTQQAFDRVVNQFIDQPQDTDATKNMKKAHRDILVESGQILAGPLAAKSMAIPLASINDKPGAKPAAATETPTKNSKGWTLHVDANNNKAYVGPGGEIEEVH